MVSVIKEEIMNYNNIFGMRLCFNIFFSIIFCFLLFDVALAASAEGSVYTTGQFSAATANGNINGTNYSGSASSVLGAITNDAQGLQNGAVIGISGNAVLTPNKAPVINSYNINPKSANQSSMIRIFISAVYTNQVLVNIIRPDDIVDEVDMSSQSVYYYPNTDTVGRYTVLFSAVGNTVTNADDYFDIVEDVPYTPPDDEENTGNRGGSQSGIILNQNYIYLSILRICTDKSGIIVEAANDTDVISGALVTVKSSDTDNVLFNAITDGYGSATFDLPFGNYTIIVSDSNQNMVSRNYELYCQEIKITDGYVEDNSSITSVSGQSTQANLGSENILLQSPSGADMSEVSARQSLAVFTNAFLVFLTSASLIFIFSLVLLLLLYRKSAEDNLGFGKKSPPTVVILDDKNVIAKKLTPVEEAIIKIEDELKEISQENKKRELLCENVRDAEKTSVAEITDEKEVKEIKTEVGDNEVQETLDMSYEDMPYKEKANVISAKRIHPYLSDVQKEHDFVLCNGEHINNLKELLTQLTSMSEGVFRYHVTDYKNDFATWIYHSIGYKELAETIGLIKSKEKMVETIKSRVDTLNKTLLS
jgi:hypothetical protein